MDRLASAIDASVTVQSQEPNFLFYADDILICLPKYDLHNSQNVLNACHEWSRTCGLSFGAKKCAAIGLKPTDTLYLGNDNISSTTGYKYLGFDLTLEGIDWKKTWGRAMASADKFLDFLLSTRTKALNERIKATIIRTYVESKINYPMTLWCLYSDQDQQLTSDINTRLLEMYHKCLEYVFGYWTKTTNPIQIALSHIPEPTLLQKLVKIQVTRQLAKIKETNPLEAQLRTSVKPNMVKIQQLINENKDIHSKLITETWIKHKENLLQRSKLVLYMNQAELPVEQVHQNMNKEEIHHRKEKEGREKDWSLGIKDCNIRKLAIQTRTGYLFRQLDPKPTKCPQCNDKIKRTHFNTCNGLRNVLNLEVTTKFNEIKTQIVDKKLDKYTILDYLLNRHDLENFKLIMIWLGLYSSQDIVEPTTSKTPLPQQAILQETLQENDKELNNSPINEPTQEKVPTIDSLITSGNPNSSNSYKQGELNMNGDSTNLESNI